MAAGYCALPAAGLDGPGAARGPSPSAHRLPNRRHREPELERIAMAVAVRPYADPEPPPTIERDELAAVTGR
jgi:hypothetical protein